MQKQSVAELARNARQAGPKLAVLSGQVRDAAIAAMAKALTTRKDAVLEANALDCREASAAGLSAPLVQRLRLSEKMFRYMVDRLQAVSALPDPLGVITHGHTRPSGLRVERISVPLGVVGIIYESRPNVTTDAAGVCLKSGNAVILRGGSEALRTNTLLSDIMSEAAGSAGAPADAIQIVRTSEREAVGELLKQDRFIDVIIPRGGKSLIERIAAESRIPVIKHYDGICHQYIAADADTEMAVNVAVNSKCEKVEVCNAMETLLIDAGCAERILPKAAAVFQERGVELRGCPRARSICEMLPASEDDWSTEYLAPVLSIKIVAGIEAAIEHINGYGSHHTDGIVTSSLELTERFVAGIDSASVMVNASTRLSGGGDYGLGAVVGISTDKLHARGPVGPEELTTYKWLAYGAGHLR